MGKNKKVQFNLCIPKHNRDQLRRMAAQTNLENPGKVVTAASLGTEIICKYLDEQERRARKEKKEESHE